MPQCLWLRKKIENRVKKLTARQLDNLQELVWEIVEAERKRRAARRALINHACETVKRGRNVVVMLAAGLMLSILMTAEQRRFAYVIELHAAEASVVHR